MPILKKPLLILIDLEIESLDFHYDCSGGNNSKAKITICLNTGIFYDCLKDACETYNLNYDKTKTEVRNNKHGYLKYT